MHPSQGLWTGDSLSAPREEIPAFLAKPGPDDYVLVYFSGHGFKVQKDKQEKLYLAPIDCDPARACVTIHYVDPDTLESLKRQGPDPAGQR